jgi:hypothetical protein
MALTIEGRIASAFQSIPQVESIYVLHNDEASFSVVTVLSNPDRGAYAQVFEQEGQLLDSLSTVHFDFHVLARRGRSLDEIVGSNIPVWQRNP